MKTALLKMLIEAAVAKLDSAQLKEWVDAGIDKLEDAIESSDNKIDDALLPIIKQARVVFSIPDNDE